MLTDFCISFGLYMILTEGPNFISNILDKDIFEVTASAFLEYSNKNASFGFLRILAISLFNYHFF